MSPVGDTFARIDRLRFHIMPFRFVPRDGVRSKLLTKKKASAYGTPFKGKRLRLRKLPGLTQRALPALTALPDHHKTIAGHR